MSRKILRPDFAKNPPDDFFVQAAPRTILSPYSTTITERISRRTMVKRRRPSRQVHLRRPARFPGVERWGLALAAERPIRRVHGLSKNARTTCWKRRWPFSRWIACPPSGRQT